MDGSDSVLPVFILKTTYMYNLSAIKVEGKVIAVLPSTLFHVELTEDQSDPLSCRLASMLGDRKEPIIAHISGKMREKFIKLTVGDRVKMVMTPYDLNKARIIYRVGRQRVPVSKSKVPIHSYGPRRNKKRR